jgi:magnesium transporter
MSRKNRRRRIQAFFRRSLPGSAPGTLIADPEAPKTSIRVIAYDAEKVVEQGIDDAGAIPSFLNQWPVTWIQVTGLGGLPVITRLGEIFGIHRLALEDVINVHQRPKVEQYSEYCYVVVRAVGDEEGIASEQISLFLGKNYVLSFQERASSCFDPVIQRIREGKGRSRIAGPDHLAYALIDVCIDRFFPVLERYGELIEVLEDEIVDRPDIGVIERIHEIKRGMMVLRRTAWPMREAMTILYREPIPLIDAEERIYLRDCYDHMVQIIDLLENYRDVTSGLMEVYLSSISNRTNEIMKVLTILSAIFIPLTLIAGIYGMNFQKQMPDLGWRWGFPFALGLMAAVAGILLIYFRIKGWLGASGRSTNKI